jgi:hypothetical protein
MMGTSQNLDFQRHGEFPPMLLSPQKKIPAMSLLALGRCREEGSQPG